MKDKTKYLFQSFLDDEWLTLQDGNGDISKPNWDEGWEKLKEYRAKYPHKVFRMVREQLIYTILND